MIAVASVVAGVALILTGLWLVYPPGALIVAGAALVAAGLLVEFPGGDT